MIAPDRPVDWRRLVNNGRRRRLRGWRGRRGIIGASARGVIGSGIIRVILG